MPETTRDGPRSMEGSRLFQHVAAEFFKLMVKPGDTPEVTQQKRDARLVLWNLWAEEVARDVTIYRRPTFMDRPATLPDNDNLAYNRIMAVVHKGSRALQADKEMYDDWLYWKNQVMAAEEVAIKRLSVLVEAVYWSEQIGDSALLPRIARLRDFIRKEYGVDMPRPCPGDHRTRSARWACDRNLLPMWMIAMTRPRMFATTEERDAKAQDNRRVPGGADFASIGRVVSQLDLRRGDEGGGSDG